MITGTLTQTADGRTYTASVSTLLFDVPRITVTSNAFKSADNHPDFHLAVMTPRRRPLRVGAMWTAVSEKSKRTYYSLSLTDRMGKTWRMNAVRADDAPEGVWQIVPLAGGQTEPTPLTGHIETLDDGNLAGAIGSYDFDLDFAAVENAHRTEESHPHWHMEARSPAGVPIRMGSIWRAKSERTGTAYLSLAFHSPYGVQHRANAFAGEGEHAGEYDVVALIPAVPDDAVI